MKKQSIRRSIILLSSIFALPALVGCAKKDRIPENAKNKTIITIGLYNGGTGTKWAKALTDKFAELYQDVSFSSGKTGVYFDIQATASNSGDKLEATGLNCDIYFTEAVNYGKLATQHKLADISDVITSELTEFGENKTIESKLDTNLKNYLKYFDGNYYALPFYDGLYGFIYDRDVFNENRWFFKSDGKIGGTLSSELSLGADGIAGTYDDGLPATFEEFDKLCEFMKGDYWPLSFAGSNASEYVNRYAQNIWADCTGYEQMNLNYTFNGEATNLVNVDNDGGITPLDSQQITYDNGYLLRKQVGKYYGIKFLEDHFLTTGNISNYAYNYSHTDAQTYFVNTLNQSNKDLRFGIHLDGVWFEEEALNSIEQNGDTRLTRNFGFLPIPKVDASKIDSNAKQTIISLNNSFAFINANTKYLDLCKKVMAFLHTDASLSSFTQLTSIPRPLHYSLTAEDEAKTSFFGKSVMTYKNSSNVVYPFSSNAKVLSNASFFINDVYAWSRNSRNDGYDLIGALRNGVKGETYFNDMYSYASTAWPK